ncbi:hypothetical protein GCM10007962_00720 [Yeosuana aromativorans]|uniref:T9SS C-terminal target domain-containing protein n=1 Tax=Yeosuana aromativorans TaxID=288019 RepID=A0A8J3BCW5_9FLAO|nr:T9SS type A sorting domain-containing protein [Yeosuana aromativorans]GGK10425.1 hypothetical protein GCM10007962_00720 [Yeosuana aromativorans]
MKQKLLLIILPILFFAATLQAQDKVWDFGGSDTVNWGPDATGVADNEVRDNLGIYMGTTSTSNIGIIDSSNGSVSNWQTAGDIDGYSSTTRFKFNGDSGISDLGGGVLQPSKRYIYFAVTGACTVKLWLRGSSGRTVYLSDDSFVPFGSVLIPASGYVIETVNYTGGSGNIYIYDDAAVYLCKMVVSPASSIGTTGLVLSADDFKSQVSTNMRAVGNRIYVSNVKTKTEVNIYSITGALVKSFKTNSDTDFTFRSGLWIATLKTVDGQKSVKLLTH